ncbi:MAG: OmpA family protein [Pseudomonadota bacterium]
MRTGLGIVVLVAGIVALGWYASKHHAKRMEQAVTDGAQGAVAGSIHGVSTAVSGRDIEVSGLADSSAERDGLLETLEHVRGHRVVRDKLDVLAAASPYVFSAEKKPSGELSVSGNVPTEAARAGIAVALDHDASGLKLASGAPDAWTLVAEDGIGALSKLYAGRFAMSDTQVSLSGLAQTPKEGEAALSQLKDIPPGYTIKSSFDYLDDGKPANFQLIYSAAEGAEVSGKLPQGISKKKLAASLGLDEVSGAPTIGLFGDPSSALAALKTLKHWLPEFEVLKLQVGAAGGEDDFGLTGDASPGADIELLKKGLAGELGGGPGSVTIAVEEASDLPPDGTSRVNAATGETEVMTAGYWLPKMDFTPGYGQCRDKAEALLAKRDVNFVTGSARLDARSLRVINAITALVKNCVQSGDLTVIVGGHTDSQGDSAFNMDLSQKRADAVVAALSARGIAEDAIASEGYGDTKPVADNYTEEGRAANRRVTLAFSP